VGFADDPSTACHPICIEPETGPLTPGQLGGVLERGEEIFDSDPERLIFNTDPGVHEARQRWLQRRSRARALAEAVEASATLPGKRVIASTAGHVGGFEVHMCVALDADAFNRFRAPSSFVGQGSRSSPDKTRLIPPA
jgi:hypothetical protein